MAVTTKTIFVFGASCSGKSTLAKALSEHLGREWTYVDRDELIENGECTDDTANVTLDAKIEKIKHRVIVDAQVPWRAKRQDELYFLVLPPLQILLERDALRTTNLKRTTEYARRTRDYVVETFQTLTEIDQSQFEARFDSFQLSVDEEVEMVRTFLT